MSKRFEVLPAAGGVFPWFSWPLNRGARTPHGDFRPEYLAKPTVGLDDPAGRARRGRPGDKLRRKAFESRSS